MSSTVPVPQEEADSVNERRLWIGNLDTRITEFVMLKLVQKFGKPERFDFIYHLAGPEKGKPRGYCFVTYTSKEVAEKVIKHLDGKLALSRRLVVRWAKDKQNDGVPGVSEIGTPGSLQRADMTDESAERPTMSSTVAVPQKKANSVNKERLWIGNIDWRITEFLMLKLVQKFGKPERFEFLYHGAGPLKGKPRGFCLVTYASKEVAEKAIKNLDGKLALSRRLIVRWEKDKPMDEVPVVSEIGTSRSLQGADKTDESAESTEIKIRAIEAKLTMMEKTQKEFGLSELPAAPPGTSRYSAVNAPRKPRGSIRNRGNSMWHMDRRGPSWRSKRYC